MEQFKLFSKKPAGSEKALQRKPEAKNKVREFRSKEEYYKSEEWQTKRLFALHRAGHRCEKCASKIKLDVHHLTYDNLYDERPEDVTVLCSRCHKKADREREYENWYDAAFDTYMSKKYGENWDYFDGCEEEFENWIESKGDDW